MRPPPSIHFCTAICACGFHLQVALAGVLAVVILERPFDVHRVRVVAFDEVGVVAVHRAHQVGERGQEGRGQTAAEACGLLGKLQRKVGDLPAMAGAVADQQWLHQGNQLASIRRFFVRFHGRY